jgi:hypothetical protein
MDGIPCNERKTSATMSDLLPNLDALLAQLTGATAGQRDARTLAEAAIHVEADDDLDRALDNVIATWRKP